MNSGHTPPGGPAGGARSRRIVTVCVSALVGLTAGAILLLALWPRPWDYRDVDALRNWIRKNEAALVSYAEEVATGHVQEGAPSPAAALPGGGPGIVRVTKDANGNVYFITKGSSTMFNVGFVYCSKGAILLGDNEEPKITHQEDIFGKWKMYVAG